MTSVTFQRPTASPQGAASRPDVPGIWSFYDRLDRTQWLSPAEMEQLQLQEIRTLLEHCQQHVPYYSRQMREAGLIPSDIRTLDDFRRLPITSRQTWQEHAADLQARQLPLGTKLVAKSRTSGTSGIPLQVLQTNVVNYWWWACQLRDLEWSHIDPLGDLAAIRSPKGPMSAAALRDFHRGVSMPTWFPELAGLMDSGSSHAMDIRQRPENQLAWLRSVSPNYLLSYPSNLDALGELIRDSGQRLPRLRAIQAISETLNPEVRKRIEDAFGVPVKSIYSCAEAGHVASQCPDEHGLHVHAEHVLLEVLNASGQPCAPGETGRAVLTSLHNYLNPFIRYEIQDQVTLAPHPCPCGRGLPLLTSVHGRVRPPFQLPGGGSKSSNEMVFGLSDLGGHRQHQIIQRSLDHVIVRIVPNDRWTADHPQRLTQVVHQFFEQPIEVEVQIVGRIEPAASGKIFDMICELPVTTPRSTIIPEPHLHGAHSTLRRSARQPTVLFGRELGGGMGPAYHLLPLAKDMVKRGFRVVFAVADLERTGTLIQNHGFEVLQAPFHRPPAPVPGGPVTSYGDILGQFGFQSIETLEPMVHAWQTLLDVVNPDLIICNHSPTLCLTAYETLPTMIVGNGFCVPPGNVAEFPKLIPSQPVQFSEHSMLNVIQEAQRRRGRRAPSTLPGLFATANCLVTSLPVIDPYGSYRTQPAVGPLESLAPPSLPPDSPSYFAYLDAEVPGVDVILAGLMRSGIPGQVYLRNLPSALRENWQWPGLEILPRPPLLSEILNRVAVVVHHGSDGTAQHALAVGRPQLVFPIHLEHFLNARVLHGMGVGNSVINVAQPDIVTEELQLLLADRGYADRAWVQACEVQNHHPGNGLAQVMGRCLSLLQHSTVLAN